MRIKIKNNKLCDILYYWYENMYDQDNHMFFYNYIYVFPKKESKVTYYFICG